MEEGCPASRREAEQAPPQFLDLDFRIVTSEPVPREEISRRIRFSGQNSPIAASRGQQIGKLTLELCRAVPTTENEKKVQFRTQKIGKKRRKTKIREKRLENINLKFLLIRFGAL